tara:strand:- start:731 stop:1885 length:1155 start_codon:yes stop_codon:yes gene_type:complete
MDIHNYDKKAKSYKDKIANSKVISACNKKLVLKYCKSHGIEVRAATISKWLRFVYYYLIHSKDLMKEVVSEELYKEVFSEVVHYKGTKGKVFSSSTLLSIHKSVRQIARYFNNDVTPEGIRRTKLKYSERRKLSHNQMITREDIIQLAKTSQNERDFPIQKKALLIQIEAGLRPSELLGLNCEDITFRDGGWVRIQVKGTKNENSWRNRHIHFTVPYLREWVNVHPNFKPGQPLWLNSKGNRQEYRNLTLMLSRLFKKAGIDKPADIYNCRHSAIVMMKLKGMPGSLSKAEFGHSSKIYNEVYGRLAPEDNLNILKSCYGQEERRSNIKQDTNCSRCRKPVGMGDLFCGSCGNSIKESPYTRMDEISILKEQLEVLRVKLYERS